MKKIYPFGVEFTFIVKNGKLIDGGNDYDSFFSKLKKLDIKACHEGDHLEVKTPILRSLNELRAFYNKLRKEIIVPFRLKTHFSEIENGTEFIHDTGGGHVHIGFPRKMWSSQMVQDVIRYSKSLYFLRWFFGSFSEEEIQFFSPTSNVYWFFNKCPSTIIIFSRHNTLEHRYFDAPKSLDQTLDHVNVAQAITKAILNRDFKDWMFWYYECRNDKDYTVKSFNDLMSNLGLKLNCHKEYIEKYLEFAKYRQLV